jgi:hypothetical protein
MDMAHMHYPPPAQVYYTQQGAPMPPGTMLYAHGPDGMVPAYPQYVPMHPTTAMAPHMYPQPVFYPGGVPAPYDFGPARSRNGSPTSSISSSAVSLTRSASTSSELRQQPRPKVKLSWDDKRNIVELHRSNSSLRQEDIARQYG